MNIWKHFLTTSIHSGAKIIHFSDILIDLHVFVTLLYQVYKPTITVKGQRLQVVDKFTYLGSTLSRVVHIDDEVNARIAKASAAFGRLRGSIWDRSGIRLDTKLKV